MTKYVSAALAFAAALVGVLGETHDKAHPGLAGITALGWGAILVALLSFVVILVETRRDHAKINWQERQKTKVRRIANRQVSEAVAHLLWPFHMFLTEIWKQAADLDFDLDKMDKSSTYVLGLLSKPAVRAEFDHIDLRARPKNGLPLLWWEYLAKHATEARELLNQAAAKYSGYLDADILVAIEDIRADELVYFRLPGLGELESSPANTQITPFPLSFAFGPREGGRAVDALIEKIRAILDRTNTPERAA